MNKNKKAFTLVELIVVILILAILGTIAFISLQGYSASSRDSVRISDVSSMKTALELFHLDAGKYPLPDNYEEITYGTDILRYQGTAGKTVLSQLSRSLNKIPTDPLTDKEYLFSVSGNKNEFEILNLLEGDLAYNTKQPLSGILSPSQEKEATFLVEQTNAANTTRIPRVDGQFNGLFVKTANYIFPTPSLITSEPITLGAGLLLNTTNIKSQVITGGKNIPVIGSITPKTGELNIALSVYSGTINKESTDAQKIAAMKAIQGAYSGSELASVDAFKVILDKTTDADLISAAETVILEKTSSTAQVNRACGETASGETKDFWDMASVEAGQSCDTHKKTFTCENTVWKDGLNVANTTTYSNESCSVSADTVAPTGGNFTMPATTGTTSINLTINCGTDVSDPIEMYISGAGLSSGGGVWENCESSKNITLISGDGSKIITMKWRDSVGNESGLVTRNVSLSTQSNPTNLTLNHSTRSKAFTFSWTAGVGNGGSCKLQYYRNGTTWTNISETTYNCDTTLTNQLVNLPGDGWNSTWSSIQVRIIKTSDSAILGTFSQNLICGVIAGSVSSTPYIDEDCNGTWDNLNGVGEWILTSSDNTYYYSGGIGTVGLSFDACKTASNNAGYAYISYVNQPSYGFVCYANSTGTKGSFVFISAQQYIRSGGTYN